MAVTDDPLVGLGYARPSERKDFIRIEGRDATSASAIVAEEVPVALVYNGRPYVVVMGSPTDLEDLAVGLEERVPRLVAGQDRLSERGVHLPRGVQPRHRHSGSNFGRPVVPGEGGLPPAGVDAGGPTSEYRGKWGSEWQRGGSATLRRARATTLGAHDPGSGRGARGTGGQL